MLPWIVLAECLVLVGMVGFIAYRLHRDVKEWEQPSDSRAESRWIADRVKRGEGFDE